MSSQQTDVVFAIEKSITMKRYLRELLDAYISPALSCFSGGVDEENDLFLSMNSSAQYALVFFGSEFSVMGGSAEMETQGPTTSQLSLLNAIKDANYCHRNTCRQAYIMEALQTAIKVFKSLSGGDIDNDTKRCLILVTQSVPIENPWARDTPENIVQELKRIGVKTSIISAHKMVELYRLFENAGGDPQTIAIKNYATKPQHLVLLNGFTLQEQVLDSSLSQINNVTPASSTCIPSASNEPSPTPVQRRPTPSPVLAFTSSLSFPQSQSSQISKPTAIRPNLSYSIIKQPNNPGTVMMSTTQPISSQNDSTVGNSLPMKWSVVQTEGKVNIQNSQTIQNNQQQQFLPFQSNQQHYIQAAQANQQHHHAIQTNQEHQIQSVQANQLHQVQTVQANQQHQVQANQLHQVQAVQANQQHQVQANQLHQVQTVQANQQHQVQANQHHQVQAVQQQANQQHQMQTQMTHGITRASPVGITAGCPTQVQQPATSVNQTSTGTPYIWQGTLEWIERKHVSAGAETTVQRIPCKIARFQQVNGMELKTECWSPVLQMLLIQKSFLSTVGNSHFEGVQKLLFLPEACPGLVSLSASLSQGFAACLHISGNSEIKMIILLISSDKRSYVGFIPKNQPAFVLKIKQIFQNSNKNQQNLQTNINIHTTKDGFTEGKAYTQNMQTVPNTQNMQVVSTSQNISINPNSQNLHMNLNSQNANVQNMQMIPQNLQMISTPQNAQTISNSSGGNQMESNNSLTNTGQTRVVISSANGSQYSVFSSQGEQNAELGNKIIRHFNVTRQNVPLQQTSDQAQLSQPMVNSVPRLQYQFQPQRPSVQVNVGQPRMTAAQVRQLMQQHRLHQQQQQQQMMVLQQQQRQQHIRPQMNPSAQAMGQTLGMVNMDARQSLSENVPNYSDSL